MVTAALIVGSLLAASAVPAQAPQQQPPDRGAGAADQGDPGPGPGGGPHGWGGPGGANGPHGPDGSGDRNGFRGPDRPGFRGPGGGAGPGGLFGDLFNPPPFLAAVRLTEEQQDKVFSILYAAAPAIREQSRTLRTARKSLIQSGASAQFDEAKVRALANTAAKAESELTLLRARTDHQIYLLLTPAQRSQVEKQRGGRRPGGPDGPQA